MEEKENESKWKQANEIKCDTNSIDAANYKSFDKSRKQAHEKGEPC